MLQVAIDYVVPHLTLKTTVGLTQNPKVVVAATTGQKGVVAGTQATYDTNKGYVTTWDAGVGYNAADFQAHIMLTDAGMSQQNASWAFMQHVVSHVVYCRAVVAILVLTLQTCSSAQGSKIPIASPLGNFLDFTACALVSV